MDVEAQDDGVVAKIMVQDGAKSVKVGQRIAVLADPGDDVKSLEIPAEEASTQAGQPARKDRPSPQAELEGGIDRTESSESAAEAPPSSKPNADAGAGGAADTARSTQHQGQQQHGKAQKQRYPLYPSVQHLLHEKGLTKADADTIPASGPNGRLLKGDVLAFLGRIEKSYPATQSQRIIKLGHLDLSNIQLAASTKTPKPTSPSPAAASAKQASTTPPPPADTAIAMPISLSAVLATQKRVHDALNIHMPLSTFIARASELANENLPSAARANAVPSADALFASVLGLRSRADTSTSNAVGTKGRYFPSVTGQGAPALVSVPAKSTARSKGSDIIDLLSSSGNKGRGSRTTSASSPPSRIVMDAGGVVAGGDNVFSVLARAGEERRVQAYLGRMKVVLETEPGRLVL